MIPGLRRSPGEGNGNPLQCSCQGDPMDRGAWQEHCSGLPLPSPSTYSSIQHFPRGLSFLPFKYIGDRSALQVFSATRFIQSTITTALNNSLPLNAFPAPALFLPLHNSQGKVFKAEIASCLSMFKCYIL